MRIDSDLERGAVPRRTRAPAPARPAAPRPSLEHERLAAFIGFWRSDGRSRPSPRDPTAPATSEPLPVPMRGTHTYDWLPGKFFVVHRWDQEVGAIPFAGLWIMGWDEGRGVYVFHLFDSEGHKVEYEATVVGDAWTVVGDGQRATIELSLDGSSMRHRWFVKQGADWAPLCDLTATRVS